MTCPHLSPPYECTVCQELAYTLAASNLRINELEERHRMAMMLLGELQGLDWEADRGRIEEIKSELGKLGGTHV